MKMKYETLRNPAFAAAWSKIMSAPMPSAKLACAFARASKCMETESRVLDTAWKSMLLSYGDSPDEQGFVSVPDDKMDAFKLAVADFDSAEIDIPDATIRVADLDGVKLSPRDFALLESFISVEE